LRSAQEAPPNRVFGPWDSPFFSLPSSENPPDLSFWGWAHRLPPFCEAPLKEKRFSFPPLAGVFFSSPTRLCRGSGNQRTPGVRSLFLMIRSSHPFPTQSPFPPPFTHSIFFLGRPLPCTQFLSSSSLVEGAPSFHVAGPGTQHQHPLPPLSFLTFPEYRKGFSRSLLFFLAFILFFFAFGVLLLSRVAPGASQPLLRGVGSLTRSFLGCLQTSPASCPRFRKPTCMTGQLARTRESLWFYLPITHFFFFLLFPLFVIFFSSFRGKSVFFLCTDSYDYMDFFLHFFSSVRTFPPMVAPFVFFFPTKCRAVMSVTLNGGRICHSLFFLAGLLCLSLLLCSPPQGLGIFWISFHLSVFPPPKGNRVGFVGGCHFTTILVFPFSCLQPLA